MPNVITLNSNSLIILFFQMILMAILCLQGQKNTKELVEILTDEWYKIKQSCIDKLIESMSKRVSEVILKNNKGFSTRY